MKTDDLKHIARLSRIRLTNEELERFSGEMETILESARSLDELDTDGVKIISQKKVALEDLRDDVVEEGLSQELALRNAPNVENGYVKVYGALTESSGA